MKMKLGLWIICLLTSLYGDEKILKIDDIVQMALKHSPDIDAKRLDFKSAQERVKGVESFYLPTLDLALGGGKQWSKLKNAPQGNIDILAGTLGASQLLYDFGKVAGKLTGSKQEALALEAQMQQSISDKILRVKEIYYEILKSRSIIEVQQKNVLLQKQQLKRAQKYLEAGIKTIIDVSDAHVQLEQAQLDLTNAHYDLELRRVSLEEEIGFKPYKGNYRLYSPKLKVEGLSNTLPQVSMTLESLEKYAYRHRYVLEGSEYYARAAQANVESAQGEYAPTLSLSGEYTLQNVDESALVITPERQGQVMVNMRWNLFSGYQTDALVQESKIGLLKAASQAQSAILAVRREVVQAHISLRQNEDSVKLSESISKASYQKFQQAQKRYENELSDYVELQDAQQGYITSLSNVVKSYYDSPILTINAISEMKREREG